LTPPRSDIILYDKANCHFGSRTVMKAFILGLLISSCVFAQEFPLVLTHSITLPNEDASWDVQFWMNEQEIGWAVCYNNVVTYKLSLDSPEQIYVVPDTLDVEMIALFKWENDPAIFVSGLGVTEYDFAPVIRYRHAFAINLATEETLFYLPAGRYEYDVLYTYSWKFVDFQAYPRSPSNTTHIILATVNHEYNNWNDDWFWSDFGWIYQVDLYADTLHRELIGPGYQVNLFRDVDIPYIAMSGCSQEENENSAGSMNASFGIATFDSVLFLNEFECWPNPERISNCAQTDADGTRRLILARGEAYNPENGDLLWEAENFSGHYIISVVLDSTGHERVCLQEYSPDDNCMSLHVYDAASGTSLGYSQEIEHVSYVLKASTTSDLIVTKNSFSSVVRLYRSSLIEIDDARDLSNIPQTFTLSVYPNPFNPTTTISYSLPVAARGMLDVFNVMGQRVLQTDLGLLSAGAHSYMFDASALPSGIYFAQLSTPDFNKSVKLLLTK
jgi:hypothetical protein